MLQIMAHAVLRDIVRDVREAKYFSIIADESTDVSGQQQFTLIIRHVSDKFVVHEDFIGLYEIAKADADSLRRVIEDCLIRLDLNMHFVRGQGYDGASVMAGARNGVAAKIAEIEPRAVYIHCAGHTLNLALQDCTKRINCIRDALELTREMINFIRCSPKRSRMFDEVKLIIPASDQMRLFQSCHCVLFAPQGGQFGQRHCRP